MSDEERYCAVMKEIGELLKEKNERISYLNFRVSDLQRQLEKAEDALKEKEKQ